MGLNFDTLRPRRDILRDYEHILRKIYDPEAFARRLRRLASLLDIPDANAGQGRRRAAQAQRP